MRKNPNSPIALARRVAAGAAVALLGLTAACGDDATGPTPAPLSTVTIAPPSATVYEQDYVTLQAVVRDRSGNPVPGASLAWSASDERIVEIAPDGGVLALRAGTVRVTARVSNGSAAGTTGSFDLVVAPLAVQQVTILPAPLVMARGDVRPIGVRVQGQGGRTVPGRLVTLATDNPAVAFIDAAGRIRAVSPGQATIRATADGVVGTAVVQVSAQDAVFNLGRYEGQRLPLLVASDSVTWDGVREFHEVYVERGSLRLSGTSAPRYEVDLVFVEYRVSTVDGRRTMIPLRTDREYDRGIVQFDSRGDLAMISDYIAPLAHIAIAGTDGMQLHFRVPGENTILQLLYRREPD